MPDGDVPDWWKDDQVFDALLGNVEGGDEAAKKAHDAAAKKVIDYLSQKYGLGQGCRVVFTRQAAACFWPTKAWLLECGDFSFGDDPVLREIDELADYHRREEKNKGEIWGEHTRAALSLEEVGGFLRDTIQAAASDFEKAMKAAGEEPSCPPRCKDPRGPAKWSTKCDFGRIASGRGKGRCEVKVELECGHIFDDRWHLGWSGEPTNRENIGKVVDVKTADCPGFGFIRVCTYYIYPDLGAPKGKPSEWGGAEDPLIDVHQEHVDHARTVIPSCPKPCWVRQVVPGPVEAGWGAAGQKAKCTTMWFYCSKHSEPVPEPPPPPDDWPWGLTTGGGEEPSYAVYARDEEPMPSPVNSPVQRGQGRRRRRPRREWVAEHEMFAMLSDPRHEPAV